MTVSTTIRSALNHDEFTKREFDIGMSLMRRNQFLDALDRFSAILKRSPYHLPDILIPLYQHLNTNSQNLHLRILIAKLYMAADRFKEAVQELEECIQIDPHFTQSYFLLSKIYSKGVEKPIIQSLFETAFENGIFDSAILDLLPIIYLESQKTDKSIVLYKKLIEINPNAIHYYKMLGELYSKSQAYSLSAQTYKTASELSPKSTPEFAKLCEQLIDKAPQNKEIRNVLIDLHLKSFNPIRATAHIEALVRIDKAELQNAIAWLKRCLNLYPNTHVSLVLLSACLASDNQFSESIEILKTYKSLPNSDSKKVLGVLQFILNQFPDQVLALHLMMDETFAIQDYPRCLSIIQHIVASPLTEHHNAESRLKSIQSAYPPAFYEAELCLARYYNKTNQHTLCAAACSTLYDTQYDLHARMIHFESSTKTTGLLQSQPILYEALTIHPFSVDLHQKVIETYTKSLDTALHAKQAHQKISQDTQKNTRDKKGYEQKNREQKSREQKSRDHHAENVRAKNIFEKGLVELRKGDIVHAIETFQNVTSPKPLESNATILISRCFLELGRFDLCQKHLEGYLSKLSDQHTDTANKIRYLLSINLIHFGKISEAVQLLEQIMITDIKFPNIQPILTTYKQRRFKDMRGLALSGVYHQGQLHPSVIPNTEKLKKAKEAQTISFAHPHNNQGVHYMVTRSLQAAQDEFNLALQMDPQFTVSYCNLALVYIEKNEVLKAKKILEKGKEINPEFELIDHHLGLLALKCNQPETAIVHFQNVLKKNPENYYADLNLSDIYRSLGNLTKAFTHLLNANRHPHLAYLIHRRTLYLTPQSLSINDWICSKTPPFFDTISPLLFPDP